MTTGRINQVALLLSRTSSTRTGRELSRSFSVSFYRRQECYHVSERCKSCTPAQNCAVYLPYNGPIQWRAVGTGTMNEAIVLVLISIVAQCYSPQGQYEPLRQSTALAASISCIVSFAYIIRFQPMRTPEFASRRLQVREIT
jgi:hypothetical protein